MYFLLGISIAFALLLVLNILSAIFACVLWRVLSKPAQSWTAQNCARLIFGLRVFPFACALVFVLVFLLPAYLLFEPYYSAETVSFKLASLSLASAVGVGIALYRVLGTWRATRRLVSDWMLRAEPIEIAKVSIPVYRIEHPFPVIAVIGMLRPRMFIANQIFTSLDEEEFQAAIRHETGHLDARDNLKRTLMRACSDSLVFPFGRAIDRAWAENVEAGADEYAAQTGGKRAAVNLAAALIKIARIVPQGVKPAMPSGAFLIERRTAEIARRVQKLLQMAEEEKVAGKRRDSHITFWLRSAVAVVIALTIILPLSSNHNFLLQIHNTLEAIVAVLQ